MKRMADSNVINMGIVNEDDDSFGDNQQHTKKIRVIDNNTYDDDSRVQEKESNVYGSFQALASNHPSLSKDPFYFSLPNAFKKLSIDEMTDPSGMLRKSTILTKSIFNINRNYHFKELKVLYDLVENLIIKKKRMH